MTPKDPFAAWGAERTIIKPRLGAAASGSSILDGSAHPAPSKLDPAEQDFHGLLEGLMESSRWGDNALVRESGPLLRMACLVRQQGQLGGLKTLSNAWIEGLNRLHETLTQTGQKPADCLATRYIVCTVLDEFAANTPWGGSGSWAPHSMLLHFFGETWGGEKVFALGRKLMKAPSEHWHVLELLYTTVCLGFKGKYQVQSDGAMALAQLRMELNAIVQAQRQGAANLAHPCCWQSTVPNPEKLVRLIPLGFPLAVLALVLAGAFAAFHLSINAESDASFEKVSALALPSPEFAGPTLAPRAASQGLELPVQLQTEIIAGALTLRQFANQSTVILTGDRLFESAQAELNRDAIALVQKVARELARHPGQIRVTGYTDNQAIRSLRYPSNWQLSHDRAKHVSELMMPFMPNVSMASEGAGAANPVASNATPEGRARNRRVEITLIHQP